jgi:polyhydroxybutyrate depolymerase
MKKMINTRKASKHNVTLIKVIIASLLSVLLSACGGGSSDSIPSPTPPLPIEKTAQCAGSALDVGNECVTLNGRDSILYQPGEQQNEGIAIFLHGSPGDATKVMGIFDGKMIAEKYSFVRD